MNDRKKFKKLTRPIPFRRTKLKYRQIKGKVLHFTCFILYKIKVLKRFTYHDTIERQVDDNVRRVYPIESNIVKGHLVMTMNEKVTTAQDWFYFKNKNKKLLTIWDTVETYSELSMVLDRKSIVIRIGDVWKHFDFHNPRVRVALNDLESNTLSTVQEYTLDLNKLYNLRNARTLESYGDDIDYEEYMYYVDMMKSEFTRQLNSLTLQDLLIDGELK